MQHVSLPVTHPAVAASMDIRIPKGYRLIRHDRNSYRHCHLGKSAERVTSYVAWVAPEGKRGKTGVLQSIPFVDDTMTYIIAVTHRRANAMRK